VNRHVITRAPTRIDLGGGWTDVPPYCDREGGFVCNVAITRHAVARLESASEASSSAMEGAPLVQAALRRSGIHDVRVTVRNDFPIGAGLGGSSAASAAVIGALRTWRGEALEPAAIAEEGRRIEVEDLGVAGGRQDHYAATHGGVLALSFNHSVVAKRIAITPKTAAGLVHRSVLVYTGESRISGDTITAVLGAYERREPRVVDALAAMRRLARDMVASLETGDIDALGEQVQEHWTFQRSLHPSIPTPRIDEIIERGVRAGALGAKAMGASGGGCVLLIARAGNTDTVRDAVASLGKVLPFEIDTAGLTVLENRAA